MQILFFPYQIHTGIDTHKQNSDNRRKPCFRCHQKSYSVKEQKSFICYLSHSFLLYYICHIQLMTCDTTIIISHPLYYK